MFLFRKVNVWPIIYHTAPWIMILSLLWAMANVKLLSHWMIIFFFLAGTWGCLSLCFRKNNARVDAWM